MNHKYKFKFGDIVENAYAGQLNPHKFGIFIKYSREGYVFMNTKGDTWTNVSNQDGHIFLEKGQDELIKCGTAFKDDLEGLMSWLDNERTIGFQEK